MQTVTWGGGKISSTQPYNALECQTRQLVQGLNKVTGKLRDPAIPWRLEWEPQGQGTGKNG